MKTDYLALAWINKSTKTRADYYNSRQQDLKRKNLVFLNSNLKMRQTKTPPCSPLTKLCCLKRNTDNPVMSHHLIKGGKVERLF